MKTDRMKPTHEEVSACLAQYEDALHIGREGQQQVAAMARDAAADRNAARQYLADAKASARAQVGSYEAQARQIPPGVARYVVKHAQLGPPRLEMRTIIAGLVLSAGVVLVTMVAINHQAIWDAVRGWL